MVVINNLYTIFLDNLVERCWRKHFSGLFHSVNTFFCFLCVALAMPYIKIESDFFLIVDLVKVYVWHFHLFVKHGFVPGPVIFLKCLSEEAFPSPSEGVFASNLHCIVHVNINVVKRWSKWLGISSISWHEASSIGIFFRNILRSLTAALEIEIASS